MPVRCVLGCERPVHRFPIKFPELFKAWVYLMGGKLENPDDYLAYKNKRICAIHFTEEDYDRNNKPMVWSNLWYQRGYKIIIFQPPCIRPRLVDSKWFNADSPCDEEAEIAALEHANQLWLNSIGQQYMKRAPLGKTDPEPMEEEADTDEEEGNDESDESEESHDEDEEEDVPTSYSPTRNNNELEPDSLDDLNEAPELNSSDQSALWPIQ